MHDRRTAARKLGQGLVAAGAAVLVFVGYQAQGTGLYTAHAQFSLRHALQDDWDPSSRPQPAAVAPATLGSGVAILRVPRFGRDYVSVIVEGVGTADLRRGPGHYPASALPGAIGNFAVAGHRTTYGAPFARLDELQAGDALVLETRRSWLTYRVTESRVVAPTAVTVTAPVPGEAGRRPTAALLTFTTCHPRHSDRQRLVVFGRLVETLAKSVGPPVALRG